MTKLWRCIILILIIGLQACKKDDEPQGNTICASNSFRITDELKFNNSTASGQHINFTYSPYYAVITAAFNEDVSWTLTIKGNSSGAIKTYTDVSSSVNIHWYGNPDRDIFFQTGETCTIILEPACKSSVSISAIIDHAAIFDHYGFLLFDLDYKFPVYTYVSDVPGIQQYVRNVDTLLSEPSPQGNRCQKLYAPAGHSGWYIGGMGCNVNLASFAQTTSSDSIYINLYIKGFDYNKEDNSNVVAMISIKEQVDGIEYMFNKGVTIDWVGWKMISYKLSDLAIGVPANIKYIDIQAGSNVFNAETECYVDFVILTKGKAFSGPN